MVIVEDYVIVKFFIGNNVIFSFLNSSEVLVKFLLGSVYLFLFFVVIVGIIFMWSSVQFLGLCKIELKLIDFGNEGEKIEVENELNLLGRYKCNLNFCSDKVM